MYTLGINAALASPSACLVRDGVVVAAAEEECFTGNRTAGKRVPLAPCDIPFHAINYCLSRENIVLSDVDHIAYSFNPFLLLGEKAHGGLPLTENIRPQAVQDPPQWPALFLSAVASAPDQLCFDVPLYLADRFANVTSDGPFVWHFVDHHLAHAASAFLASPFPTAAVMTLDDAGETASAAYSLGAAHSLTGLGEVPVADSLSRVCAQVAEHLGFPNPWEAAKVVELAAMGKPSFADEFRKLIVLTDPGQYITRRTGLEDILGPARGKNEPLENRHLDIAASLQAVVQETVLALIAWLKDETGEKNLCLAGELANNIRLNGFLRRKSPFEELWIPPAAGDAGTAVGAALWIDGLERGHPEGPRAYAMDRADLGPSYPENAVESFLSRSGMPYRSLADVAGETAALLASGKTVGWFQGKMEFGPRPLGWRSILGSPLRSQMRDKINRAKGREEFRLPGAAIAAEETREWLVETSPSPFMLFTYTVAPDKREMLRSCCREDGYAAVQTVGREENPLFHSLLAAFKERTGVPVLLHSSLNVSGKPVACSPQDAAECFWTMPLDALVIGRFLLEKPADGGRG